MVQRLAGEGVPHALIAARLVIWRTTVIEAVTCPPLALSHPMANVVDHETSDP